MQATVRLEYADDRMAKAVTKAVSPDNRVTPEGLKIETVQQGNEVVTEIGYDGKLATFTATIDDLLFCASTAEKTLKAVTTHP